MEILLLISTIVLAILLAISLFFLWKFTKIIMIFEDDLSETIDGLNEVDDAINNVLTMQMFFDSPEVKEAVQGVLEQVRLCRMTIQTVVQRFTARSKRQYVTVWEDRDEQDFAEENITPRLPGQPPGTPNPMEVIQREGMVLDVGRPRK